MYCSQQIYAYIFLVLVFKRENVCMFLLLDSSRRILEIANVFKEIILSFVLTVCQQMKDICEIMSLTKQF